MKKILISIAVLIVAAAFVLPNFSTSKGGSGTVETVTKTVLNTTRNSQMDYESTMILPNGEKKKIIGKMAMNAEGFFYDSSNSRFLLYNDTWMIHIDHESKMGDVVYLPKAKEQLGGSLEALPKPENWFTRLDKMKNLDFKTETLPDGNYWLHNKSKKGETSKYEVSLLFDKDNVLREYKGTAEIPLTYKTVKDSVGDKASIVPDEVGDVAFRCYNIDSVQAELFNDDRLIENRSNGAYMKRYKKYKTFKN